MTYNSHKNSDILFKNMIFSAVTFSQEFSISRELLFEISQDHTIRLKWDSYLVKIELLNNAKKVDKGVTILTKTKDGVKMQTIYTEFIEPIKMAVSPTSNSNIFSEFNGEWIYDEVEKNKSNLTINYYYKLRFPYILIGPLIKKKLIKTNKKRLQLLKEFVEMADR